MDLRKQKEKVQSRETNQQAKLHSLDEINKLVELHKYGLVDFDEQLVRRLVEKITIFQRYMEFTFKDGEVIRVNIRQLLVCNIPNFARLFVMTSASICACNPTKLRA